MIKKELIEFLENKIEEKEKIFGFVEHNGYAQVEGKGEKLNREYGEYVFALRLLEEL